MAHAEQIEPQLLYKSWHKPHPFSVIEGSSLDEKVSSDQGDSDTNLVRGLDEDRLQNMATSASVMGWVGMLSLFFG